MMWIYRNLKQRGLDPLQETETALRQFMTTGQLPPLPTKICSTDCRVTFGVINATGTSDRRNGFFPDVAIEV
ncbi:hypothetical protein [Zavarzinella formosa]|uniref:hypothetical protein n=1 Tax=Zavarzinella formosa TaxID=360055 RepID=UPI00138AF8AC|nr:hypothetical protein [Zavarzinella formosa]